MAPSVIRIGPEDSAFTGAFFPHDAEGNLTSKGSGVSAAIFLFPLRQAPAKTGPDAHRKYPQLCPPLFFSFFYTFPGID